MTQGAREPRKASFRTRRRWSRKALRRNYIRSTTLRQGQTKLSHLRDREGVNGTAARWKRGKRRRGSQGYSGVQLCGSLNDVLEIYT